MGPISSSIQPRNTSADMETSLLARFLVPKSSLNSIRRETPALPDVRSFVLHSRVLGLRVGADCLATQLGGARHRERRHFYKKRGTCEQVIKEGRGAINWTRLSCGSFAANAVKLQLHAPAYSFGNFLRTLAKTEPVKDWSLADQDQREDRHLRPLRRFPDGGGRHSEKPVRRHPADDRGAPEVKRVSRVMSSSSNDGSGASDRLAIFLFPSFQRRVQLVVRHPVLRRRSSERAPPCQRRQIGGKLHPGKSYLANPF